MQMGDVLIAKQAAELVLHHYRLECYHRVMTLDWSTQDREEVLQPLVNLGLIHSRTNQISLSEGIPYLQHRLIYTILCFQTQLVVMGSC